MEEAVAQRPPVAAQEAILAVVPVRPHARIFERAIRPRYNFAEAGRILERKAETLRRWSIGHDRVYRGEPRTDPPLIIIDGVADGGGPPLSFLNLIELRFLTSWRDSMPLHLMKQQAIIVAMVGSTTSKKTTDPVAILNSVCNEGWELVNGSFVFVEEGQQSRDKFGASGQNIATKGTTVGYYLFRRCEANRREAGDPWEQM
jgi:hypothetical protein